MASGPRRREQFRRSRATRSFSVTMCRTRRNVTSSRSPLGSCAGRRRRGREGRLTPRHRGAPVAGGPALGVPAAGVGVRDLGVDDQADQPGSRQAERHRAGAEVAAVQVDGAVLGAEQRGRLVHDAGGGADDVVLGTLADGQTSSRAAQAGAGQIVEELR